MGGNKREGDLIIIIIKNRNLFAKTKRGRGRFETCPYLQTLKG
jgi:hypothetical protein